MKNRLLVAALLLFLLPLPGFSQTVWKAYSSSISFKIKNAGVTVTGRFDSLQAHLVFSPDKLGTSSLKGNVAVSTIKTGIDKRDKDLKKEGYFDAEKYRTITIASTKLYKKGTQYAGMFNVTIKGTTKQIEIPFDFIQHTNEAEFSGNFTINRRDFGVGGSSMIMADDLNVTIVVKAKE